MCKLVTMFGNRIQITLYFFSSFANCIILLDLFATRGDGPDIGLTPSVREKLNISLTRLHQKGYKNKNISKRKEYMRWVIIY